MVYPDYVHRPQVHNHCLRSILLLMPCQVVSLEGPPEIPTVAVAVTAAPSATGSKNDSASVPSGAVTVRICLGNYIPAYTFVANS